MSLNKLGRYDIIRVLGKGAMGLVYEARDPNLNRRVAIKTIKVENLSEEAAAEYEARFKTEAHSAARLQHPNIVSVYDSDRHGNMAFLVMEFIQGEDLKHHLDGGKRFSLAQSLVMMRELLSALDYAHRQAIVHRDVKPANLLIEADGRVKLTDFGVARIQDSGDVTRTQGSMVGTLKYMSPEQVQGQPIDARADLFAAGIVLYQLLTGKRAFDGDTDFAIIQQIVNHTPAAPSSFNALLPPELDAVLARALAKKRDQRFSTAQEFAQALQQAIGQAADPTIVPPASPPGRPAGQSTDTGLQRSRAGGSTLRGGTDTGSTVTQELELVYWKDIKDSDDIEDLDGFLVRFPSGIYADLARRRLKKLGGTAADDSVTATLAAQTDWTRLQTQNTAAEAVAPPTPDADATLLDATVVLAASAATSAPKAASPVSSETWPLGVTAPAAAPTAPTTPAPLTDAPPAPPAAPVPRAAMPAQPPALTASSSSAAQRRSPSKTPMYAVAGVVLLVLAGLAFKFFSGQAATDGALATLPAASAPLTAASAVPAVTAVTAPVTAAATPPAPTRPAVRPPVDKPVKQAPAPAPSRPVAKETPAAAAPPAAVAAPANPKLACENRVLLGFQICMNEQCALPRFRNHAACVERREQDKMRQEIRDGRQ